MYAESYGGTREKKTCEDVKRGICVRVRKGKSAVRKDGSLAGLE